jgi:hypothetical protein
MNDQPCTTCGNPIGMTLKESLARMNRVMPFVTQHEALKAKLLKWENDLKQRSIQIEETASRITTQAAELQNEREKLAQDEQALEELLTAASIPAQKFESLRSENQELQLQTKSAEQEHHKAFTKASKTNEMLLLKLKDEKQKQMESDKDRTLSRRELLAATSENKKQNRQIDQLNRKLVSLQVKYDRECEQRKQRKETKKAGSVSRTEVLKLQQELDDLTREHTMLQTRYAREARLLEAEREKNRHVEPSPRKKPAANDEISKKLASLRTKNKELLSEIDALKEQVTEISEKNGQAGVYTSFAIGDLDLLNSLSQEVSELFSPPSDIVTLGSGPFPESDFDDYLRTLDITPRADGCSWIIIGREDWSEEQLNALIDASDLDEVKVFSQELFVAGILTTHDPFSLPLEILKKFAEGHPALEYLINSGFEWPEIIVEEDFGEPAFAST